MKNTTTIEEATAKLATAQAAWEAERIREGALHWLADDEGSEYIVSDAMKAADKARNAAKRELKRAMRTEG